MSPGARKHQLLPKEPPATDADIAEIVRIVTSQAVRDECDIERITDELKMLALSTLDSVKAERTAPSMAGELKQLELISTLSRRLCTAISGLHDLTREGVHSNLKYQEHPPPIGPEARKAGVRQFAPNSNAAPARALISDRGTTGLHPLRCLSDAADLEIRLLKRIAGSTGGPGNLLSRTSGDPRLFLATRVALIIGAVSGPSAVKGTRDGTLHQAVAKTWFAATGLDSEGSDIFRFVKLAAKAEQVRLSWLDEPDVARREVVMRELRETTPEKLEAAIQRHRRLSVQLRAKTRENRRDVALTCARKA